MRQLSVEELERSTKFMAGWTTRQPTKEGVECLWVYTAYTTSTSKCVYIIIINDVLFLSNCCYTFIGLIDKKMTRNFVSFFFKCYVTVHGKDPT